MGEDDSNRRVGKGKLTLIVVYLQFFLRSDSGVDRLKLYAEVLQSVVRFYNLSDFLLGFHSQYGWFLK